MAKCKLCNSGGFFTPVDNLGFCNKCRAKFDVFYRRHWQIFSESCDIAKKSKNLETMISRYRVALGSLDRMKAFGNGKDVMHIVAPELTTDGLMSDISSVLEQLEQVQGAIDNLVVTSLEQEGSISKRQILDAWNEALNSDEFQGRELDFDLESTLPDLLARLENEGKITKQKQGNKYVYSLK